MRSLLVTVGSTKFDDLIDAIQVANDDGSLKSFINKFKLDALTIQHGNSPAPKLTVPGDLEIVDYINPERMSHLLTNSTVIISHAGAGTIFEVLRNKSAGNLEAFVVVENATLMDSHQLELIDALIEMKCPLQVFNFKSSDPFDEIQSKAEEIDEFQLPEPDYKPLTSLINSWLVQ